MQIIVGFILLAGAIAVVLIATLIVSLLLGGSFMSFARTKPLGPLFLSVVPMSVVGAAVGGVLLGRYALERNENAVVLAVLAGLIVGALVGLVLGGVVAVLWWRQLGRRELER